MTKPNVIVRKLTPADLVSGTVSIAMKIGDRLENQEQPADYKNHQIPETFPDPDSAAVNQVRGSDHHGLIPGTVDFDIQHNPDCLLHTPAGISSPRKHPLEEPIRHRGKNSGQNHRQ